MTNGQMLKNNRFIWTTITTISLNLIVGMYFIIFEKDVLESLFHSAIPFLALCLCNIILILFLCLLVFKRKKIQSLLLSNTEERGFVFMDLNSSTSIAEVLGHRQYSNFLRDTFSILEQMIEKIEGLEIYQYVGDEIVLSWQVSNEKVNQIILYLLPNFQKLLTEQDKHFHSLYNFIPTFKCAIHGGNVTKVHLGKNHAQTAFHGDVLNTTSRILGLCHQFNTCVLASEFVYNNVKKKMNHQLFERLEAVDIQGKSKKISLLRMKCDSAYYDIKENKINFSNPKNDHWSHINNLSINYEKQKQ